MTEADSGGRRRTRLSSPVSLLLIFFLALGQTIWLGYLPAGEDSAVQTPLIKRILDSDLYPGDPMLATARSYVSFFPHLVAGLTRVAGNLEAVLFGIHLAAAFAFLVVVSQISRLLFKSRSAAVLALLLMLPRKPVLGVDRIHYNYTDQTFIFYPLALLAVFYFLKNRRILGFALAGAAFNFQALTSLYVAGMMGFCVLAETFIPDPGRGRMDRFKSAADLLKRILPPAGAFLVCALPALFWLAVNSTGGGFSVEWIELIRLRSGHHVFPFSWNAARLADYALFLVFAIAAARFRPPDPIHARVFRLATGAVVMCAAGVIFTEFFPLAAVIRLQLFRSTVYVTIFALLYIAAALSSAWKLSLLHRAACAAGFAALFFFRAAFALLAPALLLSALAGVAGKKLRGKYGTHIQRKFRIVGPLLIAAAVAVRGLMPLRPTPPLLEPRAWASFARRLFGDPLLLALMGAVLLVWGMWRLTRAPLRIWSAGAVAALVCLLVIPSMYRRFHGEAFYSRPWIDVQTWARSNTPAEARFLTPPYRAGFRVISERAIVGDWKDGTQIFFDPGFASEWSARMRALGGNSRRFNSFGWMEYAALAREYAVDYLVVSAHKKLDRPPVYVNREYAVYRFGTEPGEGD